MESHMNTKIVPKQNKFKIIFIYLPSLHKPILPNFSFLYCLIASFTVLQPPKCASKINTLSSHKKIIRSLPETSREPIICLNNSKIENNGENNAGASYINKFDQILLRATDYEICKKKRIPS